MTAELRMAASVVCGIIAAALAMFCFERHMPLLGVLNIGIVLANAVLVVLNLAIVKGR